MREGEKRSMIQYFEIANTIPGLMLMFEFNYFLVRLLFISKIMASDQRLVVVSAI